MKLSAIKLRAFGRYIKCQAALNKLQIEDKVQREIYAWIDYQTCGSGKINDIPGVSTAEDMLVTANHLVSSEGIDRLLGSYDPRVADARQCLHENPGYVRAHFRTYLREIKPVIDSMSWRDAKRYA